MRQCGLGRRFKRCPNPAENTCVYCGRDFCGAHRYFVQDHEAVCNAKYCVAKQEDLKVYLEYRKAVEQRNRSGICGNPDCEIRIGAGCSLCGGEFCELHVAQRRHTIRDEKGLIERWVAVCPVCWERRKIWSRIK